MSQTSQVREGDVPARAGTRDGSLFLSPEWVYEVTRVVQAARSTDAEFGKLASGFSLNLVYLITDFPPKLREEYGASQLAIFVSLDKGTVRKLLIGKEAPDKEKVDFTVSSNYGVAKEIFLGQRNAATTFINREIKVEPLSRVYQRPRFSAKAVVTGNAILRIARTVPTTFLPEG